MTELNYRKDSKEQMPYEHYLNLFQKADPQEISRRLEIPYEDSDKDHFFSLKFLGINYKISWPEFTIEHQVHKSGYYPLEEMVYAKILVLRYLVEGKKIPSTGQFKTFRDLPWGEVYHQQFNGRCILRLAYGFGNKPEAFEAAMKELDGVKLNLGDVSYELELFDGYKVKLILWQGDDEFPPSSQILFSDNFAAGLSGEDRVVTGDVCIGTLKEIDKRIHSN